MSLTQCICHRPAAAAVTRRILTRYASTKPSPTSSERDSPNVQQAAFSDPILSDASSPGDPSSSNLTSTAGTPAADRATNSDAATGGRKFPSQQQWLRSEEGQKFKRPVVGRSNWVGRTPFPLNPSFRPPTPLGDSQKTRIYTQFKSAIRASTSSDTSAPPSSSSPQDEATPTTKSETYYARQLSSQYGLSIDRIKAIVRLKALEENLSAQGVELQQKFQRGMEEALGVPRSYVSQSSREILLPGQQREVLDVAKETREEFQAARRSRWLLVDDENPENVQALEAEESPKKQSSSSGMSAEQGKQLAKTGERSRETVQANTRSARAASRPHIQFVDVPNKAQAAVLPQEQVQEGNRSDAIQG